MLCKHEVVGSIPTGSTKFGLCIIWKMHWYEPVAQLVEYSTFNRVVAGSSPAGFTKFVIVYVYCLAGVAQSDRATLSTAGCQKQRFWKPKLQAETSEACQPPSKR